MCDWFYNNAKSNKNRVLVNKKFFLLNFHIVMKEGRTLNKLFLKEVMKYELHVVCCLATAIAVWGYGSPGLSTKWLE
jgi:hypothetical protein